MAQVKEDRDGIRERASLVLRQRPGYAAAVLLVAGALAGAAVFGVVQAQDSEGVLIESDGEETEPGEEDAVASSDADAEDSDADAEEDATSSDTVVVDISGAVASPAVVELPAGSRVQDAIEAAGGLTDDADITDLNRAAELADGEKIYVPHEGEEVEATTSTGTASSSSSGSTSSDGDTDLVNINTADADELDTLPGVGPATAEAIIEDREANGPFTSIEDIMRVSGIGEAKFADMQDYICV